MKYFLYCTTDPTDSQPNILQCFPLISSHCFLRSVIDWQLNYIFYQPNEEMFIPNISAKHHWQCVLFAFPTIFTHSNKSTIPLKLFYGYVKPTKHLVKYGTFEVLAKCWISQQWKVKRLEVVTSSVKVWYFLHPLSSQITYLVYGTTI